MAEDIQRRVLSIQSHVVHGYCGNRSATFPLQVFNILSHKGEPNGLIS